MPSKGLSGSLRSDVEEYSYRCQMTQGDRQDAEPRGQYIGGQRQTSEFDGGLWNVTFWITGKREDAGAMEHNIL